MTSGVTLGAALEATMGVDAIVGTRVAFGVKNAEVAFGVKSDTLKVATGVNIGVLASAVIAVTIGVSIG